MYTKVKENLIGWHFVFSATQIILGSILLGLSAQIAVPLPFTPVPMTLQTLAIAFLALSFGSKKASLAVVVYLIQASMGWPVLSGGASNPLWILAPFRAGYLLGFLVAVYVMGKWLETQNKGSFLKNLGCFLTGEAIILGLGTFWLSFFVGIENAITMGAFPFMVGALVKACVAATALKPFNALKNYLSKI
jgi:biotin transport system substrate-specific component